MPLTKLGARLRAYVSQKEKMLSSGSPQGAMDDDAPGELQIQQPVRALETEREKLPLASANGVPHGQADVSPVQPVPQAADERERKLADLLEARQGALSRIEGELRQDPNNMQLLQQAASCMGRLGLTRQALRILHECLRIHPRSDWPWAQLSGLYLQHAGEVDEGEVVAVAAKAVSAAEKWKENTSDVDKDREYVRNLVPALLLQRKFGEAADALSRWSNDFAHLRAMLEYARGNAPAVESTMLTVMRAGGDPITVFCRLAQALAFRGNIEAAFQCLQNVQQLVMVVEDGFYNVALSELVNSPFVKILKDDDRWPAVVHSIGQSQARQLQFNYEPAAQVALN